MITDIWKKSSTFAPELESYEKDTTNNLVFCPPDKSHFMGAGGCGVRGGAVRLYADDQFHPRFCPFLRLQTERTAFAKNEY